MSEQEEKLSDVEISIRGIDLMVNNDWDGCEKLFTKYKDLSPLTNYCYSFVSYMRGILTFEDHLLDKAQKDVEATEKLCSDTTKKFSLKKAFGFPSSSSSHSILNAGKKYIDGNKQELLEEKFTKAIILADCKLYSALLTFVRQDVTAYIGSGLIQIRRSWKMYSRLQKQLYDIYKKLEPNAEQIYGSDPNSSSAQIWLDDSDESSTGATASNDTPNGSDSNNNSAKSEQEATTKMMNELSLTDEEVADAGGMPLETVKRLLGAVSFGYGLFQICLSFAPPNVLRLIKVFGFEGDRNAALKAINFTSQSRDMRAPFADMVLLWYSTVAIPLFGASDDDITISQEETKRILDRNLTKYSKSSLFLYMQGKYNRSLARDLNASMASYQLASEYSKHIKEIQLISIYEIGWLHLMMNLDYAKALESYESLFKRSRWSKSFSGYCCAVMHAAMGNFSQSTQFVKESIKALASQPKRPNPIELFSQKRCEYLKKHPVQSKIVGQMLVIEMLYLWITFPFMEEHMLKKILELCDQITDKAFISLKCLYEGGVHMALKNYEFGEQCFNEVICRAENEKPGPFGKYALPLANLELASYYASEKKYTEAKAYLTKAQSFKDYELENRAHYHMRALQRQLKNATDGAKLEATLKARAEAEREHKEKKENEIKNFYMS